MRALCWNGIGELSVQSVEDPGIINPHDAIIKVTMSSVCGSDLHLLDGFLPTMQSGDIIGHEFTGVVVETGSAIRKIQVGDRVVVGSVIGCGECVYCASGSWGLCDNSNPNAYLQERIYGATSAAVFGFSHAFGGYPGSHAQFIRVPFADHGAFKIPEELNDDQVIFLSDTLPTGYMAADLADIRPGDTVAVWGCGSVGLMAIQSAFLFGAGRVIGIDRIPWRLKIAEEMGGAIVMDYTKVDVPDVLREMTGGRGPDRCIDAVGMEAVSTGMVNVLDKVKQTLRLESDHPFVLREAILSCRKGGTVSIAGVYNGLISRFPIGAAVNKGLTIKAGIVHPQNYIPLLFDHLIQQRLNPSRLLTHRMPLEKGPEGYDLFKQQKDNCLKVIFTPNQC
jgi:threonine dehydrogenase-like Zn-dependent dehydrogenase